MAPGLELDTRRNEFEKRFVNKTASFALILFCLSSIAMAGPFILRDADVFQKKVELVQLPGGGEVLAVSGLAGHSAYAVEPYEVTRTGAGEQVLVIKAHARRGRLFGRL